MNFTKSEVKSGVLVVVSFVLLTALTFKVSDFRAFGEKKLYKLHFDFISGLEKNAPVHFAGHSVGTVKSITISDKTPVVEVVIEVDKHTPVRADSEVYVDTLGLLGEKFISVSPGAPDSPILEPGGVLEGNEPTPIHHMITQMNDLTAQLLPLTEKTNTLLEGDIKVILENLNAASANLKEMTSDLKRHPWKLLRKK